MQVKSSCLPTSGDLQASWGDEPMIDSCRRWSRTVVRSLTQDRDLEVIVMSGIARDYASPDGSAVRQLRDLWSGWVAAGKRVVVMADPPALGRGSLPECLAGARDSPDPCASPSAKVRTPDPLVQAARGQEGVTLIDLTDVVCDRKLCHAVVGGLPVFADQNHLLHYFVRTLVPRIESQMSEIPELTDHGR